MTHQTHDRIKLMSLYNVTGNARIMIDQVDHDACAIRHPRFYRDSIHEAYVTSLSANKSWENCSQEKSIEPWEQFSTSCGSTTRHTRTLLY